MENRHDPQVQAPESDPQVALSGGVRDPEACCDEDRTLIRWMLGLTPAERLAVLQNQALALLALRDGRA